MIEFKFNDEHRAKAERRKREGLKKWGKHRTIVKDFKNAIYGCLAEVAFEETFGWIFVDDPEFDFLFGKIKIEAKGTCRNRKPLLDDVGNIEIINGKLQECDYFALASVPYHKRNCWLMGLIKRSDVPKLGRRRRPGERQDNMQGKHVETDMFQVGYRLIDPFEIIGCGVRHEIPENNDRYCGTCHYHGFGFDDNLKRSINICKIHGMQVAHFENGCDKWVDWLEKVDDQELARINSKMKKEFRPK